MNLQQLEYIVALDRIKNFSKAADFCNVTQATLSAMVKKLEEELDIVIFDRKKHPLLTTECGKEIVEEAKKVLLHANNVKNIAQISQNKVEGTIKIGIIPTVANSLLPLVLKAILENYPDLKVELHELTTHVVVNKLKEGEIDIGIVSTPLDTEDLEENILYYEMLLLYGPREEGKEYVIDNELKYKKMWLLEEGHCLRNQVVKLCDLKKSKALNANLKFEANSFETIINMVDSLGGFTLLPELYVKSLSPEKANKITPFNTPIPVREISLVYHRPYAKSRIIEALTALIKEIVNKDLRTNNYKKSDLNIISM